ncbi:rab-GTPase-TBC domain-containing protein [Cokeromyces recurvatus]|uniref:rab-GTPase-TBC domain-containing protein n=1 Tax=Cokeromyces recurvatus TaxID=90255 RepID=UPI00222083B3|nr:rab-GTPase-TBC domain-containing protein [Cokeromyces recurvatus]KAI7903830.1 rab-GTPase-TBC domain-containing protein [Cokeromyces recurvatus]
MIDIDEEDKRKLEGQLNRVIVHVLRSYPSLHYYQGYHDICSVFILLFGEKYATKLMESVALFYLRYEMYINMEPVLKKLTILDTLIRLEDEELYHFITEAHVLPYYCLSWVITWCSHDLDNLETITRLFDLFLSSNPFMVIYFSAALVLSKRNEIVTLPAGDTSTIHTYLAKLPKSLDHVETLCQKACQLEEAYSVLELQYQSSVALDQVSTVNRFEQDWLPIKSLEDLNHTIQYQVIPILKDEKERLPIELKSNTNSEKKMNNDNSILQRLSHLNRKDALLYTLVTVSASVGLLAILVSNSDLIREWLLTGV